MDFEFSKDVNESLQSLSKSKSILGLFTELMIVLNKEIGEEAWK